MLEAASFLNDARSGKSSEIAIKQLENHKLKNTISHIRPTYTEKYGWRVTYYTF